MKVLWIIEHTGEYRYALELLRGLKKITDLKLHIAGVIPINSEINPAIPFIPERQFESVINNHKEEIEKSISFLKKKLRFDFKKEIITDTLPRAVERIRKRFKPSLTIIEPEPLAPFPFSIGSPTASMIRNFKEDFLVIKGDAKFPPRRIALPVDMSSFSIRTIKRGLAISNKFNAIIEIFTVVETRHIKFPYGMIKDMLQISEKELKAKVLRKYTGIEKEKVKLSTVEGKNAEDGIIAFLHKRRCDLVILGKHGHTFIEDLLGTVTEKVIRYSPVPVWVVSNPQRRLF